MSQCVNLSKRVQSKGKSSCEVTGNIDLYESDFKGPLNGFSPMYVDLCVCESVNRVSM